jgi:regulatory protein
LGLERLSPLGDERGEPTPRAPRPARTADPPPTAAWGVAERAPAERALKPTKPRARKSWPTREEREAKAVARGLEQAAEIAKDPTGYARQVCLELLELGPRTRRELATALEKKGVPEDAAEEVLSRYADVGLIDDAQFASLWVASRHRGRGLAGRALSQELRRKGIDDDTVKEAVAELEPEQEEATARALVRRKLPQSRNLPTEARVRRLAGMLARKGYSGGLAFRVVKEELEREGAEVPDLDTDGLSGLE